MSVHDINKGRGPLEVLEVDVPEDPGVDDHMVLDIVIWHCDTAIPDFPLCHSHPDIGHHYDINAFLVKLMHTPPEWAYKQLD